MSTYPEGYPESEIIRAAQTKRAARPRRWLMVSRIASLIAAIGLLAVGLIDDAGRVDRSVLIFLNILWFMPLIWFPSQCGNYVGTARVFGANGCITDKSPAFLVAVAGWVFLIGFSLFWIFLLR